MLLRSEQACQYVSNIYIILLFLLLLLYIYHVYMIHIYIHYIYIMYTYILSYDYPINNFIILIQSIGERGL